MNSVKALPLYLNISLLCYPSVNKWKISNTTIDLVYCDSFTHELRIPYFVSYESPPDRGSMVENGHLRVNEPLRLWREVFRLTTTLSFEALQRPAKFLKIFTDAFFLTTTLTFVTSTTTEKRYGRYLFLLLLLNSQQPLSTRGLQLAYLIPERGCFNLVNAGDVASLHLQRKHLNKSFRIR